MQISRELRFEWAFPADVVVFPILFFFFLFFVFFRRHNVKGHFVAIKMLCHARDEVKRAATGAREIIARPPHLYCI